MVVGIGDERMTSKNTRKTRCGQVLRPAYIDIPGPVDDHKN